MVLRYWICVVAVFLLFEKPIDASVDEYRLLEDLRKEYDPVERPVEDHRQAVNVSLRIVLYQVLEIASLRIQNLNNDCFQDEKNQLLTLVVWLHMVCVL